MESVFYPISLPCRLGVYKDLKSCCANHRLAPLVTAYRVYFCFVTSKSEMLWLLIKSVTDIIWRRLIGASFKTIIFVFIDLMKCRCCSVAGKTIQRQMEVFLLKSPFLKLCSKEAQITSKCFAEEVFAWKVATDVPFVQKRQHLYLLFRSRKRGPLEKSNIN